MSYAILIQYTSTTEQTNGQTNRWTINCHSIRGTLQCDLETLQSLLEWLQVKGARHVVTARYVVTAVHSNIVMIQ